MNSLANLFLYRLHGLYLPDNEAADLPILVYNDCRWRGDYPKDIRDLAGGVYPGIKGKLVPLGKIFQVTLPILDPDTEEFDIRLPIYCIGLLDQWRRIVRAGAPVGVKKEDQRLSLQV